MPMEVCSQSDSHWTTSGTTSSQSDSQWTTSGTTSSQSDSHWTTSGTTTTTTTVIPVDYQKQPSSFSQETNSQHHFTVHMKPARTTWTWNSLPTRVNLSGGLLQ